MAMNRLYVYYWNPVLFAPLFASFLHPLINSSADLFLPLPNHLENRLGQDEPLEKPSNRPLLPLLVPESGHGMQARRLWTEVIVWRFVGGGLVGG